MTISSVNYAVIPFFTLGLRASLRATKAVAWHYHIIVVLTLVLFQTGMMRPLRKLQKKDMRPPVEETVVKAS